jgi:hypothetical protein
VPHLPRWMNSGARGVDNRSVQVEPHFLFAGIRLGSAGDQLQMLDGQSIWLSSPFVQSRWLVANPYCCRVHSTSPDGSLPFFMEKPWIRASIKTPTCVKMPVALVRLGTGRYRTHPSPPLVLMVSRGGCEPVGRPGVCG